MSAPDTGPKLVAVEGRADSGPEGADASATGAADALAGAHARDGEEKGRSSRLVLLLAAALVVSVLVLGVQLRRSQILSGRVEALSVELQASEAQVERYRGRLSEVRDGLAELSSQVQALLGLVEEGGEGDPAL